MNQSQIDKEARRVVEGGEADRQSQKPGDNRTPDKTIGQVKYADNEGGGEERSQGGSTRTATLQDQRAMRDSEPSPGKQRAQQSQKEGPAAYAPQQDEPTAGDEAQKRREKMQRMEKAEGDR